MGMTYRVADATTWRELEGEIVALDTDQSVYFSIGGFGTTLWPALVTGASKQDLVGEITSAFDGVPAEQAAADVEDFLTSLSDLGLIEATTG
jgi:hypothetical protein